MGGTSALPISSSRCPPATRCRASRATSSASSPCPCRSAAPATSAASSSIPATPGWCITPTSASTSPTARGGSTRADPAPGYDGLLARSAEYPDGHFLGWTPGQIAPLVDGDLAWRLDPGTDLVVQLHMQPSGKPEAVQPSIGFFFSDTPPTRMPSILRLGSQGIDIAAGRRPLRRRGSLHAAGRRDAARGAAARALPGRRRQRHRHVPRRHDPHADPHRPLGLPLAARLPLHRAGPPAQGHDAGDALRLRQLAGEPAQSAGPAGARALGPAIVRRDGRLVVPARHRQRGRPGPAARRGADQDDRRGSRSASRRCCCRPPATPSCTTTPRCWRCCSAVRRRRSRTSASPPSAAPTRRPRTTTSARRSPRPGLFDDAIASYERALPAAAALCRRR